MSYDRRSSSLEEQRKRVEKAVGPRCPLKMVGFHTFFLDLSNESLGWVVGVNLYPEPSGWKSSTPKLESLDSELEKKSFQASQRILQSAVAGLKKAESIVEKALEASKG